MEAVQKKKKLTISALESCPLVSAAQWKFNNKDPALKQEDLEELWTQFLQLAKEGISGIETNHQMTEIMWKTIVHNRVSQCYAVRPAESAERTVLSCFFADQFSAQCSQKKQRNCFEATCRNQFCGFS